MLSSMTDGEKEREKVFTAARSKGDALVSFEDEGDDDTDDLTTRYENQFEQYFCICLFDYDIRPPHMGTNPISGPIFNRTYSRSTCSINKR